MDNPTRSNDSVGYVIIGRNEGERLEASLGAIQRLCPTSPVVYVDSGSTDDSVAFARSLGFQVVQLDLSVPFTAARARNAGFQNLLAEHTRLDFVQFLDGDCELQPGWVASAVEKLRNDESVGIVSGRRHEKLKDASVYNALMDYEWDTPIGETLVVPGDLCIKTHVFEAIDGFREDIIAGEDYDLCLRARAAGYKIIRLDVSMSYHDANLTHLSQWYQRAKRGGHAYANIYRIHGKGPERFFRQHLRRTVTWGAVLPALTLILLFVEPWLGLAVLGLYGLSMAKSGFALWKRGASLKLATAYGFLVVSAKIWEIAGAVQYWRNSLLSRKHVLIEYK